MEQTIRFFTRPEIAFADKAKRTRSLLIALPQILWTVIGRGLEVVRQRRALAQLDPHLLDDIGVSPEQAAHEAARPAWDDRYGYGFFGKIGRINHESLGSRR